ncbi:MAG: ATP-binding cassette domain-containing protein [Candidatus Riflebacteria bacterium]|nr:ATP-binding cassette domain-containing protein [Candidatus Riflebacteria bacterium]
MFEIKSVKVICSEKLVLEIENFSISSGECVAVTGPSGSGKTTFLKLFNRLVVPSHGSIIFLDNPVESYNLTELRRQIGFLFQEPVLSAQTVREALLLPFRLAASQKSAPPSDSDLQIALSAACYSNANLEQLTETLSGGEKQRVAIARILLLRGKLILLDEPTSALDEESRLKILDNIKNFLPGVTIIFVTHDRDLIGMSDRKLHFRDGKITLDIDNSMKFASGESN